MARLFLGNFDFEHQLATTGYNRPGRLAALNAELTAHLLPLTRPDDVIHLSDPLPDGFLSAAADAGIIHGDSVTNTRPAVSLQAAPWGWSDAVLRAARQLNCLVTPPPLNAVQRANSRSFSHALEVEFGVQIPGARPISAVDELDHVIRCGARELETSLGDFQWIVKAEFGMASRERIVGRGCEPDEASINWLKSRLRQQGVAHFEPRVQAQIELSSQWDLPVDPTEPPCFVGMTEILCGHLGNGIRAADTFPELSPEQQGSIVATGRVIAERLQQDGYFGPLGIDAMVYTAIDGQARVRPIQDINARWTMGRVALELCRRLNLTGDARWLHVPTGEVCSRLGLETAGEQRRFHQEQPLDISVQMEGTDEQGTGRPGQPARCLLTSPVWIADRAPLRTSILYSKAPETDPRQFPDARVERT